MVDVCRHFHSADELKTLIAAMSRYKLNTLHFHLTDDQGWRIESKLYPRLTQIGAVRASSPIRFRRSEQDGKQYGPYFFTQEEIRELVQFAHLHEVEIVPEFEMPGHALAALAAYPQYSCTGGPFKPLTTWGVADDVYCPGNDATFTFIEALLDELTRLFTSPFVHVGGDECPHTRWQKCPKCQARMKAEGLKTTDELQGWFTARMANYLKSKGKRLIGWDEILDGGLPEGTAVMSWRGTAGGVKAAQGGHDVVMSPDLYLYLDHYQFPGDDGYEYISSLCSIHNLYSYNPAAGIDERYHKYIIGVQGNLWSEYVWNRTDFEWKLFPRIAATAEVGWTDLANKNWNRFLTGLSTVELERLKLMKVNTAGLASGLKAGWEPGEISTSWQIKEWLVTGALGAGMKYEVAFVFRAGKNPLRINGVKVYVADSIVGSDTHEGVAFDPPEKNIWTFTSRVEAGTKKTIVRANVSCSGGSDSSGSIFVYAV
jgi:hexosaminidase